MAKKFKHLMIDIETLGRQAYCVILSIGAVEFDIHTGKTGKEFYTKVDLGSSLKMDMKVDASTVQWWMLQNEEARKEAFSWKTPASTIWLALERFSSFYQKLDKDILVWANSPQFDCSHMQEAYLKVLQKDPPWDYRSLRDYRTIVNMYPDVFNRKDSAMVKHNALDDCRYQIENLRLAVKALGLSERFA